MVKIRFVPPKGKKHQCLSLAIFVQISEEKSNAFEERGQLISFGDIYRSLKQASTKSK